MCRKLQINIGEVLGVCKGKRERSIWSYLTFLPLCQGFYTRDNNTEYLYIQSTVFFKITFTNLGGIDVKI